MIGATGLIQAQHQSLLNAQLRYSAEYSFLVVLSSLGALVSLSLFLFRREDWEYLWFGCVLLVEAAEQTLYIRSQTSPYPMELAAYRRYDDFLLNLGLIVSIAFYYVLLRGRRTWLFYAAVTGVLLSILGNLLYSLPTAREHFAVSAMNVFRVLTILPAILWIVSLLLQRAREKLVDARLLLAPVLLVYGNRIMGILILTTFQFGWQHRGEQTNFVLLSDPFRVNSEVLAKFLFLIAMLAILVNRFTRTRSQAERYATEFEAARNVQSLLIPATAPATPGFLAESVYLPASDVGGDFFQILPGGDGSLLVVVGDVSGKGLKAAMTVSTIVGALRDQRMCQPAEILTHLNRVLYGNVSGFVTCCAAFIAEDGAMFIANAGHLAPYLNGEEVAIDRKHTGFCLLSGALIGF